jgi:hypothetical protein
VILHTSVAIAVSPPDLVKIRNGGTPSDGRKSAALDLRILGRRDYNEYPRIEAREEEGKTERFT